MTDIMLKGTRSDGNPNKDPCEPIGVHREFFIVGRFLFVYFIFYGKDA